MVEVLVAQWVARWAGMTVSCLVVRSVEVLVVLLVDCLAERKVGSWVGKSAECLENQKAAK